MPNFNSPFLYKAIKSVIDQNYNGWELIIIDNFSQNNPEHILDKFKDDRVKFFKFDNNNVIAKSRNFGIKKSNYDWIAFLDSDDKWERNKLLFISQKIKEFSPDFLYHGMYYLPNKLGFIKRVIKDKSKEIKKPIFENLIIKGNGIANSSAVVKKNLLTEINYLSEDISKFSWEDYDCWIRCSQKTDNFLYIPEILGSCWVGGGNISSIEQSFINYKNFHQIYKNEIFNLTGKKKLNWYNEFLLTWFFKKKRLQRAMLILKKIRLRNLRLILLSIIIRTKFFFKKCKKLKI